ncbi:hypothetical protein CK203_026069 [Vitis vinifera]|uniref:Uncharacterized protein n=1 Tax=Vitis vinifera TaxID=29760 RepID=A0A438IJ64_VITVI|nr:hypothetical protein CK203_026069 [Vitis vinifera]
MASSTLASLASMLAKASRDLSFLPWPRAVCSISRPRVCSLVSSMLEPDMLPLLCPPPRSAKALATQKLKKLGINETLWNLGGFLTTQDYSRMSYIILGHGEAHLNQLVTLSCLIKRAARRGFLTGCRIRGRGGDGVQITHMLAEISIWIRMKFAGGKSRECRVVGSRTRLQSGSASFHLLGVLLGCSAQIDGSLGWCGGKDTEETSPVEEAIHF